MLVVIDAIGLYDNIPPEEGVTCVGEGLKEQSNLKVPSEFITRLLTIIQDYSVFEFDNKKYQQSFGTTMGSKPAPHYANNFMARRIDKKILEIAEKYIENKEMSLKLFKRFLDDLFLVFLGSTAKLHAFFNEINMIHTNIKFTMTHTTPKSENPNQISCTCPQKESIPYLDTLCTIKNGKIITDLYRKPTDKNQYLLTSSCHPPECLNSIPFSLGLRIKRICMEEETMENRFEELKEMLFDREYTPGIVNSAIAKARAIPRLKALSRVPRQPTNTRPVFVVSYDPRMPSLPYITRKHWRSMVSEDNYLKSVFPEPPLISYRRQQNIREKIVRAKVAKQRETRIQKGMKKCGKCLACSYIKEGKTVLGKNYIGNKFIWKIGRSVSCGSSNVVYLVQCDKDKCRKQYIGITQQEFRDRVYQHIGYVRNKQTSRATGQHFNLPGHNIHNMKFTILEQVKSRDPLYGREREKLLIRKFNSFYNGINKEP